MFASQFLSSPILVWIAYISFAARESPEQCGAIFTYFSHNLPSGNYVVILPATKQAWLHVWARWYWEAVILEKILANRGSFIAMSTQAAFVPAQLCIHKTSQSLFWNLGVPG